MFKRTSMARLAGLSVLGLALLLVASIVVTPDGGRATLDADMLAQSRGANPFNVLSQSSCDGIQGNYACTAAGANCAACSIQNITEMVPGFNGGYTSGAGTQTCGKNFAGKCNAALSCSTAGNSVGICPTYTQVVIQ